MIRLLSTPLGAALTALGLLALGAKREREARETAESVYALLADEEGDEDSTNVDSAAFCELMSEQARKQTVRYVRRSSGLDQDWDCPSAVSQLVVRAKRTGGFKRTRKAKVLGVNASGDRATASVRFGKAVNSVPLVRENGDWRLASNPAGGS